MPSSVLGSSSRAARVGARPALLAHAAGALAATLVVLAPLLFTHRAFGSDWTNHLWLMWVQGAQISDGGPSLFVHADGLGDFFPHYAFYGGTLYSIGGAISAALGGRATVAYCGMWFVAVLMAYGGMLWLSFQIGLRGWRAHAAPLLFVTCAYYLTNIYARGTWPEVTATSSLPLLLAAGLCLLRAPRITVGPALAFCGAAILLTGSHNITLVWGSIVLAGIAIAGAWALPSVRAAGRRRLLAVAGLGILAGCVNAWFVLPDLAYADKTLMAAGAGAFNGPVSSWFASPANLLNPFRHTPSQSTTEALYTQLPVLVLLWAIVACVVVWRTGPGRTWRRAVTAMTAVLVVLMVLLTTNWPWDLLPEQLGYIQFTFRLESYIVMALGLLTAGALVMLQARRTTVARRMEAALALALVFGAGLAVWQSWSTPSRLDDRRETFASLTKVPASFYDPGLFRDASTPIVVVPPDRSARVDPAAVVAGRADVMQDVAAGPAPILTNVNAGDYLVRLRGMETLGRDAAGYRVVRRPASAPEGRLRLRLEPAQSVPVVAGRWISFAALAGLLAVVAALLARRRAHARSQAA